MSPRDDTQPPEFYLRIRESRASQSGGPVVTPPLGEVIRVLAASRPGGVFLCLGDGAAEASAWILDGMDLASRLVAVVGDVDVADMLRGVFGDDLRITVHVQEAVAFLGDVRDHRFDLITDLSALPSEQLAKLALGRLALGGFLMTRYSIPALAEMLSAPPSADDGEQSALKPGAFALARLPGELAVTLVAHRPQPLTPKRRGGRRAREGVTPLFSSRPRGSGK